MSKTCLLREATQKIVIFDLQGCLWTGSFLLWPLNPSPVY